MEGHTGSTHPEHALAAAAAGLTWKDVPESTRSSVRRLFLDWLGSALAGSRMKPILMLSQVCDHQGWIDRTAPGNSLSPGPATVIPSSATAGPLVAALLNASASHVVEMDDLHNASIYHPGTCVFPAALAVAESLGASGVDLLTAAVAAYEVSLRIGEALGPEHYAYFHTTGTAGTLGAAVAAGHLLGLDRQSMLWALGSAATQAAGLWQFLSEGAMSKQLHTAKAAFDGALSAYLAAEGFTGPERGVTGPRGLLAATTAAGTPANLAGEDLRARQMERLLAGVGTSRDPGTSQRWLFETFKTPEVSIKLHPSCRHTHPSVDALISIMRTNGLQAGEVAEIRAHVYSGAYDRLKDVEPVDPWSAKFSMPFCLAQAALRGRLDLEAFTEEALADARVTDLMARVSLLVDPTLDSQYPRQWPSWVEVETTSGDRFEQRVDTPKGDPENPLTDGELEDKFRHLAGSVLPADAVGRLLRDTAGLANLDDVRFLLQPVRLTLDPGTPADQTTLAGDASIAQAKR